MEGRAASAVVARRQVSVFLGCMCSGPRSAAAPSHSSCVPESLAAWTITSVFNFLLVNLQSMDLLLLCLELEI